MTVSIARLADYPHLIADLAASLEREWPHWYGPCGDAASDLRDRARLSGFPIALIALENDRVVGTLALAEHSVPTHPQFSPWVIGFFVEPQRRGKGIGAQLLKSAGAHAAKMGFKRLYASTATAARLFVREGWSKLDVGRAEGGDAVEIFGLDLS